MKTFSNAVVLFVTLLVAGCSSDSRTVTTHPDVPTAPGMSEAAQASTKQGMSNADITQKVMQTHRLPNGQPLPGYGGAPVTPQNAPTGGG